MYGEERFAPNISKNICKARGSKKITTTGELNQIIEESIPKKNRLKGGHPSKRTFQALRIEVNRELEVLEKSIGSMIDMLDENGRICIITFHSLEDRIVKNFMKENGGKKVRISKYAPELAEDNSLFCEVSKAIVPIADECCNNPRARSAKLRYAVRR